VVCSQVQSGVRLIVYSQWRRTYIHSAHTASNTDRRGWSTVTFTHNFELHAFKVLDKAMPETFMEKNRFPYV